MILLAISFIPNGTLSFYVISSSSCEPCMARIATAQKLYPEAPFIFYDIAERENLRRFDEIVGVINEPFLPLPVFGVFEGGKLKAIVAGSSSEDGWRRIIEADFEGVSIYVDDGTGRAELKKIIESSEKIAKLRLLFTEREIEGPPRSFIHLVVPISIAAAIDAVNPCALSVFLVLLTFVLYGAGRGTAMRTGLAFSAAVFITYFLMGLGLIRAFGRFPQIKYIIIAFAIFLGVLRIIEFLTGKRRHLPGSFIIEITKYLERASNPWTGFVAGFVSASLILPCSSAPYFLALNLISENSTLFEGLLLLAIYNLIIIAPFLILAVCVHTLSMKAMSMKRWMATKRRWIDLIVGLGLISLSIFIYIVMRR